MDHMLPTCLPHHHLCVYGPSNPADLAVKLGLCIPLTEACGGVVAGEVTVNRPLVVARSQLDIRSR